MNERSISYNTFGVVDFQFAELVMVFCCFYFWKVKTFYEPFLSS